MVAMIVDRLRRADRTLLVGGLAVGVLLLAGVRCGDAAEAAVKPAAAKASVDVAATPQEIADLKAMEAKIRETVAKVTPAVVSVGGGSGVVVNSEGYVLTVAHVGQRAGYAITVVFPDGRRVRATTLGNDEGVDAGMVKLPGRGPWPSVEMGSSEDLKVGQWCLMLGYPVTFERGKPPVLRIGRVLSNGKTEVITDGAIMGGDSGAPLFSLDGKLIGIGSRCSPPLTDNIHVPVDRYRDEWDLLAKSQDFNSLTPDWTGLGLHVVEVAKELRIGVIAPHGAAEKAELHAGDVLLGFGGQKVQQKDELTAAIRKHRAGEEVEIEFRRGTETLKHQLTLGQTNSGRNP
jgi:serine protease Do